jgi:peptidoglycan/LPS O-acetylase OafA/YrhL
MQSWWFLIQGIPPILNALLIVMPATVMFAWLFFRFCEKPYMRKPGRKSILAPERRVEEHRAGEPTPVFVQSLPAIADEA